MRVRACVSLSVNRCLCLCLLFCMRRSFSSTLRRTSFTTLGGILHLSIGDEAAAIAAIEHGIKCFGVTLSDVHTELLYKKLADEVFMRMQDGRFT